MSSAANEKTIERTKIFETILSSPGMQQTCKIALKPSRQTILVLARLIENGIEKKDGKERDDMIAFLPAESLNDLKNISDELLKKGGLIDFYDHLKQF